jgi:hypothetical protein
MMLLRRLRPHPLPKRKAVIRGTIDRFRCGGSRDSSLVGGGPLSVDLLESVGVTVLIMLLGGSDIRSAFDAQHLDDLTLYHEQSHVLLPEVKRQMHISLSNAPRAKKNILIRSPDVLGRSKSSSFTNYSQPASSRDGSLASRDGSLERHVFSSYIVELHSRPIRTSFKEIEKVIILVSNRVTPASHKTVGIIRRADSRREI